MEKMCEHVWTDHKRVNWVLLVKILSYLKLSQEKQSHRDLLGKLNWLDERTIRWIIPEKTNRSHIGNKVSFEINMFLNKDGSALTQFNLSKQTSKRILN